MSQERFAKIVDVDGTQVLFFVESDDEHAQDDRVRLNQVVQINGVQVNIKLGGIKESMSGGLLDKCDEVMARGVIDRIKATGLVGRSE